MSGGSDWTLRQQSGTSLRLSDMATLQRWVVERRVSRDDEITFNGQAWRRLGDLPDLNPFFAAIGAANATVMPAAAAGPGLVPPGVPFANSYASAPVPTARWETSPQQLPQFLAGNPSVGGAPAYGAPSAVGSPAIESRGGGKRLDEDDELDFKPHGGKGKWVVLALVVVAAGGIAASQAFQSELTSVAQRFFGAGVNELALQTVANANTELKRDSYTAIEHARSMFEEAVAIDAKYAAAKAGLAQAELNRAEYVGEEASELATKLAAAALADQPGIQAEIDQHKQEFQTRVDHAFALAKEALELEPNGIDGLRAMADYYRIMKAPDSMRPLLDQARQKAPQDPWLAYVNGASVAGDVTLSERANRYFDEALEAAPDMIRARYKMARAFQAQNDNSKALLHTETILKAVPDHERARALLTELNPPPPPPPATPPVVAAEPPKEKEPTYEQLFAQADRLREADKPKQALKLYERALEQQPSAPAAYTGIGWCYFDSEAYDAAIQNFKRALDLVPRFSDAHFGIAEAYRLKGMKAEAAKHYRAYLDILPDGEDAEVAKRMLGALQK